MKKKAVFLIVIAFLLIGCNLSEAARDTTASVGLAGETSAETAAKQEASDFSLTGFECTGFLMPNSKIAQVTYRLELAEDALKLGGNGPYYLYGSGVLEFEDISKFENQSDFSCLEISDKAFVQLQPESESATRIYVGHLPFLLEVEGLRVTVPNAVLSGIAVAADTQSLKMEDPEGKQLGFLMNLMCRGEFIPGSSLAAITFVAEVEDGQQLVVSGLMETGLNVNEARPRSFECSSGKEGFFTQFNTQLGNFEIQDLMLRREDGKEFLLENGFILGFNIGMPPT